MKTPREEVFEDIGKIKGVISNYLKEMSCYEEEFLEKAFRGIEVYIIEHTI